MKSPHKPIIKTEFYFEALEGLQRLKTKNKPLSKGRAFKALQKLIGPQRKLNERYFSQYISNRGGIKQEKSYSFLLGFAGKEG